MAIYNEYRPHNFSEVKGQDAIVETLKNEVKKQKVGHSQLFVGTRGTGKTTMAKIMAKAVNCLSPKEDGSPCCSCENCRAIEENRSFDVMEIDAASNNSVDNIRQLISSLDYIPTGKFKKKVYIIDEVHMLSSGAFNALLKTIEEPPETCVFILCTTELHKVPATIVSRCQVHTFQSISSAALIENMIHILKTEAYGYEMPALSLISKLAKGSCRDSLSILEQVMLFAPNNIVTLNSVQQACNISKTEDVRNCVWYLLNENDKSLEVARNAIRNSEPIKYLEELVSYLRNVLLFFNFRAGEQLVMNDLTDEDYHDLQMFADVAEYNNIVRLIDTILDGIASIKQTDNHYMMVDIIICRCIRPQMSSTNEALLERVRMLEEKVEQLLLKNK